MSGKYWITIVYSWVFLFVFCCTMKCYFRHCSTTVSHRKITRRKRPSGSVFGKVSVNISTVFAYKLSQSSVIDSYFVFLQGSGRKRMVSQRTKKTLRKLLRMSTLLWTQPRWQISKTTCFIPFKPPTSLFSIVSHLTVKSNDSYFCRFLVLLKTFSIVCSVMTSHHRFLPFSPKTVVL